MGDGLMIHPIGFVWGCIMLIVIIVIFIKA